MRKATILVAGLLVAGAMAGCTKSTQGGPTVASAQSRGATASVSSSSDPIQFAKCMREHGITGFGDPSAAPANIDDDKVDAARQACRKYAKGGTAVPSLDPTTQAKLLQHSKCMRENGVPNFPDMPTDGSGISLSQLGIDPKSPAYQAAQKKCQNLLPGSNVGTGGN
jgi:hypothetical protein